MKSTKKTLWMSILSMVVCVAMLIGTTFAWFTDTVTTGTNKIVSGNLDIEVLHTNAKVSNQSVQGKTDLFVNEDGQDITWEPGAISYEVFEVKNQGSLALKYKLAMNITDYNALNGYTLKDVLKVKVLTGDDKLSSITREAVTSLDWSLTTATLDSFNTTGDLQVNESDIFQVIVYWRPLDNDNRYNVNNGKVTSDGNPLFVDFGINVVASQLNSESDSFGSDYDAGIILPDLPVSINKSFKSDVITNKDIVTETVVVKNTSTSQGVATINKGVVEDVIDALANQATDKKQNTDVSTIIILDVQTTDKADTAITYNINLSAQMTYTDTNDQTKTTSIENLDDYLGQDLVVASMNIGKGLESVSVKHSDVAMNKLATANTDAEGFFYNKTTGELTIKCSSFSPFTVEYTISSAFLVGDKSYNDIEEAILNAPMGSTIDVKRNVDLSSTYTAGMGIVLDCNDNVTINLNGNTITANNFSVVFQGDNLTIKNGKFVAANNGSYALFVGDEGSSDNVVLEDLVLVGGVNIYNAEVTINNCDTTGTNYYAVWAEGNSVVNIESGEYVSQNNVIANEDGSVISLAGGLYSNDPSAYVADGYDTIIDSATAMYKVVEGFSTIDTTNKTITITSKDEFILFAYTSQKYTGYTVTLGCDVDLADINWVSIDGSNIIFDGNNHTVKNVNVEGLYNVGLFGDFACSTIKNLNVENVVAKGVNHVAALCGDGLCTKIENCSVKNAEVTAYVKDNDDGDKVGAICGYISGEPAPTTTTPDAYIKNCSVDNCIVKGYRDVGGLAGYVNGTDNATHNPVEVTGNTVTNVFVVMDNLVNYKNYTTYAEHDVNIFIGEVAAQNKVIENNTVVDTFSNIDTSNKTITITNKDEFVLFASTSQLYTGYTVTLGCDVDLNGINWVSIDGSYIIFDGNNHTVKNVNVEGLYNVGLFGDFACSTIKNLDVENVVAKGINHVAALCGGGLCTKIENCSVKNAVVTAYVKDNDDGDKAGAICGYLSGEPAPTTTTPAAYIKYCSAENCVIRGYRDVGGLAGYVNGTDNANHNVVEVIGNTVKDITLIMDNTVNYKNYDTDAKHDINTFIGELGTANSTISNNTDLTVTD